MQKLREKRAQEISSKNRDEDAAAEQLRGALAKILEPEAYSRLMLVKGSNPKLFSAAVQMIVYMHQNSAIKGRVSDESLKSILLKLSHGSRRETKIEFRRKNDE